MMRRPTFRLSLCNILWSLHSRRLRRLRPRVPVCPVPARRGGRWRSAGAGSAAPLRDTAAATRTNLRAVRAGPIGGYCVGRCVTICVSPGLKGHHFTVMSVMSVQKQCVRSFCVSRFTVNKKAQQCSNPSVGSTRDEDGDAGHLALAIDHESYRGRGLRSRRCCDR